MNARLLRRFLSALAIRCTRERQWMYVGNASCVGALSLLAPCARGLALFMSLSSCRYRCFRLKRSSDRPRRAVLLSFFHPACLSLVPWLCAPLPFLLLPCCPFLQLPPSPRHSHRLSPCRSLHTLGQVGQLLPRLLSAHNRVSWCVQWCSCRLRRRHRRCRRRPRRSSRSCSSCCRRCTGT